MDVEVGKGVAFGIGASLVMEVVMGLSTRCQMLFQNLYGRCIAFLKADEDGCGLSIER